MPELTAYRKALAKKIIEQMKSGTAPWMKAWNPTENTVRLPFNGKTNNSFHGGNSLFLSAEAESKKYTDPRWVTYNQAKELGWLVGRGEKGTPVEYWKFNDNQSPTNSAGKSLGNDAGTSNNGTNDTVRVELAVPILLQAVVYNAKQTVRAPKINNEVRTFTENPLDRIKQIIQMTGAKIVNDQDKRCFYSVGDDSIHMPAFEKFPNEKEYYIRVFQQVANWTANSTRLDRNVNDKMKYEDYAEEKLCGVLSSYFIADRIGIEHIPGNLDRFIPVWCEMLEKDGDSIYRIASEAEKTIDHLMTIESNMQISQANEKINDVSDRLENSYPANQDVPTIPELITIKPQHNENNGNRNLQNEIKTPNAVADIVNPNKRTLFGSKKTTQNKVENYVPTVDSQNISPIATEENSLIAEKEIAETIQFKNKFGLNSTGKTVTSSPSGIALPDHQPTIPENKIPADDSKKVIITNEVKADKEAQPAQDKSDSDPENKVWLAVPYEDRVEAGRAGAKFDKTVKAWFVSSTVDLSVFKKWKPVEGKVVTEDDIREAFGNAIRALGLIMDELPIMDGKKRRIASVDGKAKNVHGQYHGYLVGIKPAGFIQDFRTGLTQKWAFEGATISPQERASALARMAIEKQEREVAAAKLHEKVSTESTTRYEKSKSLSASNQSDYLISKGIKIEDKNIHVTGTTTIIPQKDIDGKIWGLQYIYMSVEADSSGVDRSVSSKRFSKDSKKLGTMHIIGDVEPNKPLLIAEGYATGASLRMATGYPVVVTFDSGNMGAVSVELQNKYKDCILMVCGDSDRFSKDKLNVGAQKAITTSQAINCRVALPYFKNLKAGLSDFNDLHISENLDEVKSQIDQMLTLSPEETRVISMQISGITGKIEDHKKESSTTIRKLPTPKPTFTTDNSKEKKHEENNSSELVEKLTVSTSQKNEFIKKNSLVSEDTFSNAPPPSANNVSQFHSTLKKSFRGP